MSRGEAPDEKMLGGTVRRLRSRESLFHEPPGLGPRPASAAVQRRGRALAEAAAVVAGEPVPGGSAEAQRHVGDGGVLGGRLDQTGPSGPQPPLSDVGEGGHTELTAEGVLQHPGADAHLGRDRRDR